MRHRNCLSRTGPALPNEAYGRGEGGRLRVPAFVFALALASLAAAPASAYVGPGAGLTVIGTIFALLSAVGLAIVGFVWYPVKRLLARRRSAAPDPGQEPAADPAAKSPSRDPLDGA